MRGATRLIWIVVALALVLAPLGLPPFAMTLLTEAVILGLFAMSLDLMFGYTRLVSFGHAAAYGFGAYACGWLLLHTGMPLLFAVFAAGLLTGVMAIGVGWMCTLATGVSFSMLTLAFAQLLYAISFKWTSVTGGSDGLAGIPRTIGPFGFAALSSKTGFYYLALGCLVGGFLCAAALVRSPFGAVLRGIRENEAKTTALGYNTRLYKIAVVAISYGLGGLAGALYAPFAGFANTELLFWLLSGQVLIMVIVGGAGTLIGPVLGAAFFMLMEHQLSALTEAWALYFGLIFIAFVLFAPQGIWGLATTRLRRCAPRGFDRAVARARRRDAAIRRPGRARSGRHEGRGRRGSRRHRSQRGRQDDAVQRDHRHGQADRGTDPVRRPADRRPAEPPDLPARHIAHLPDHRAVSRDVGARECAAGRPGPPCRGAGSRSAAPGSSRRPRRSPMRRSSSSACPASPTGPPDCSRTAISACSRSPWQWRSSRACCCSTSRRRGSRSRRRHRRWTRCALPAGLADDGPSGRARHGGGVPPRPQDHGAASRRGDRRRRAGPGEGRSGVQDAYLGGFA